mgnify:CR=1 FL=1
MDPLASVKAYKDTTYFLMLAAEQRGHTVYYIDPSDLYVVGQQVRAPLHEVSVHADIENPFTMRVRSDCALDEADVVWIRTDPPVDRTYIYTTLLLDLLQASVKVVNRPSSIRDWNEKLAALAYPELTPATVVSCDKEIIRKFVEQNDRTVLKPIDGHGGKGIIFVEPGEAGLMDIIQSITVGGSQWVIAQEYLGAATGGDKRILLLNGQPLGAVLRLHADGEELNNLDQGGTALASEITDRDREICSTRKDELCNAGVGFAGIDIIGDMVIECPTPYVSRQHELCAYDVIKQEAMKDGCRWIAAPRARMENKECVVVTSKMKLTERYPIFDAANILKFNDKLLYLKSATGNELGAKWLQSVVGSEFEVITWDDVYACLLYTSDAADE